MWQTAKRLLLSIKKSIYLCISVSKLAGRVALLLDLNTLVIYIEKNIFDAEGKFGDADLGASPLH